MPGVFPIDDVVTRSITAAMDGVALQQRVIADNIANASTPGYRAKTVNFSSVIRAAIAAGTPEQARFSVSEANTPTKQDGNSVDMTSEVINMDTAALHFEALVQAMNFKISTVKAALAR